MHSNAYNLMARYLQNQNKLHCLLKQKKKKRYKLNFYGKCFFCVGECVRKPFTITFAYDILALN